MDTVKSEFQHDFFFLISHLLFHCLIALDSLLMGCEGMFFVPKEKKKKEEKKEMIIIKSIDKNYHFHSVSKGHCNFQFGARCFQNFYVVTVRT